MEQQTTEVETEVYEPPTLVPAGDFEEVTLGPGWGMAPDGYSRYLWW